MRKLNQIGDTIVEVLIAVAVLGTALGLGYGIATRSLHAGRQAQERGEALKIAEGQLERLRSAASAGINIKTPAAYCFMANGNKKDLTGVPPSTAQADQAAGYAAYPVECTSGLYHFFISYNASGDPIGMATVTVRWDRAGGSGVEELTLLYRIHQ